MARHNIALYIPKNIPLKTEYISIVMYVLYKKLTNVFTPCNKRHNAVKRTRRFTLSPILPAKKALGMLVIPITE